MSLYHSNEKTENNEYIQMVEHFYKKEEKKKKIISMSIKKYKPNERDIEIEKFIKNLLSENNITADKILNIPYTTEQYHFDGELYSYAIQKENKNENDYLYLIYFLKFYDSFDNLLSKIYNDEEKTFLFNQIVNKIKIEEKNENEILFRVGENPEKFYFLLYGFATRIIPYQYSTEMNKHEYFIYLKYIYKLDEIELFNLTINENEQVFEKYEALQFILEGTNLKFQGERLKLLRYIEKSYVSKLYDNKLEKFNYDNKKFIVLSKNKKSYEDVEKGDYIISCQEEHIKNIKVPLEEYLNNLKPINFEEEDEDLIRRKVVLYLYKIDKKIKVGEHIEELNEKSNKRSSTIICDTPCTFGVFYKKEYSDCLKVTQTKFHKLDINFLLQNELFSILNFSEFDRNYYRLFELQKKKQNQMLFNQGEINNYIYFLKQGEVSVSLEGNINDLYRIISLKGGTKNQKSLDLNFIKRFHSINLDEEIFKKYQKFPLFKINENFPIGLDDYLDEENEYRELFNVYCNMDSEVLAIKKENFDYITYREREINKIKDKYLSTRKNLLIDKLNSLKNGLIQKYILEKYKIKIIFPDISDISTENITFLNKRKPKEIKINRRRNELLYIDKKKEKNFREIISSLKKKDFIDEDIYNDKNESQKNGDKEKNSNNNSNINIDENKNDTNIINNDDNNTNQNIKSDSNVNADDINNSSSNNNDYLTKIKRRRNIHLYTVILGNNIEKNIETKENKEILDLLKSQNTYNRPIKLLKNKNQKIILDPLDKIYKNLKAPNVTKNQSNNNIDYIKNNNGYYITSFNVFSPVKPYKFIPKDRKVILPLKHLKGFSDKKMKEIKVFKTVSPDNSSVILKTENEPHDLYYDKNNILFSSLNFNYNKNKKSNINEKRRLFFNNEVKNNILRLNNTKMSKSVDKNYIGKYNNEINKQNLTYKPTLNNQEFPMIINSLSFKKKK